MIKIFKPRQSGKSTDLIKISAVTGYYIVTANRIRAKILFEQAQKLGYNILYPFTVEEYLRSGKMKGSFIKDILIDDADAVLQAVFDTVRIEAITMTYDEKDNTDIDGLLQAANDMISIIKNIRIKYGFDTITESEEE